MASCSVCGRKAVYVLRHSGMAFCEKHFLEYFDRKVRRTIRKHSMFRPRERIVVAVSGGKDSLALLHYLVKLSRKRAPGWSITALVIDEGISGYREQTLRRFEKVVSELDVNYEIVRFKDEIGKTLDEIVVEARKSGLPYMPCTFCGVFRRYLINKYARKLGGSVVATGHNLDDIVQTFIINVLNNEWDKVVRLTPVSGPLSHPKFVKKVKPFYEILEKETTIYALLNGIYEGFEECPYAQASPRWHVRRFLNFMEERNPTLKYSLLRSLERIVDLLKRQGVGYNGEILSCKLCGEPSAHPICRACELRTMLGLKLRELRADTVERKRTG
ncbi:MAG: TIGR00269 family protein [Thermoproteota archaeon]